VIGLRSVEIRLAQDDGEPVVLDDVAQGVCPACGSRYYKAETLKVIEDELRRIRLGSEAGAFLDQT
jgi:YgiT-type zinc finger domain-containing protein